MTYNKKATETQRAVEQLDIGVLLYACHVCEYVLVPQAENGKQRF